MDATQVTSAGQAAVPGLPGTPACVLEIRAGGCVRISVVSQGVAPAERLGFEVVERKGIGHPDSLADLVAEEFSRRYAGHGLERFGVVPNHWVDKTALIGAGAQVRFGGFEITKPVSAYLFGKVTTMVGGEVLPVEETFHAAVTDVLGTVTAAPDLLAHLRLLVENTSGIAADHPESFYRPRDVGQCGESAHRRHANDTVFCTGYAPASPAECLAVDVENLANSGEVTQRFPALGSDVKVMVTRVGPDLDVTVCLPFHPDRVTGQADYDLILAGAAGFFRNRLMAHHAVAAHPGRLRLAVNTKDRVGGAYLAPFGTSLGKGDCGLVGRGNRHNGVISAMRPAGVEALAGKNPLHHTGKLYTVAVGRVADRIHTELGLANEVVAVSRNGDPLHVPAFVGVRLAGHGGQPERNAIGGIVGEVFTSLDELGGWLLATPAVDRFRRPTLAAVY